MDKISNLSIALLAGSLILVFGVLFALPTMLLWNWALEPAIDGVNQIGFWQAMGINILSAILFSGGATTRSKNS